jgi:NRE family putative nickel resistance protein-like MFS transporter
MKVNLKRYIVEPFHALQNKDFAKLYMAQTISLLGDTVSWVGLALLAYQIDGTRSPAILSVALTLRVLAFIIFSPFAGVLADKINRKKILYVTHFIRMGIISCLPFINVEWQIYILVFLLNVFNAFFTPTYQAVIPQIVDKANYRQAIGLSNATFQLLGILGPGLAGILAVWLGVREIFFVDSITFVIAAFLILSVPKAAFLNPNEAPIKSNDGAWSEMKKGVRLLFSNKLLRFALSIEFVSAIAGAMILVNTINHVKNVLHLTDKYYGWLMAAFGIGAALAAFISGNVDKSKSRSASLIGGALLIGSAIVFANYVPYGTLLALWIVAGFGQSLSDTPAETLIGENINAENQGKVYGSHFAFSHLWWAIAYPITGYFGTAFPENNFLYGGVLTLVCCGIAMLVFKRK